MSIRVAHVGDAENIVRIVNAAFVVEKFFVDRDRTTLAEVLRSMGMGVYLIEEIEGGLAACVYVEVRGERGYFGVLSVDPARQGMGLGRKMVDAAEQWCARAGCRVMDIHVVNLREELPPFYERLGYARIGEAPFSAELDPKLPCHFIKMSKAIAVVPGSGAA
jgi:GNAT superfamily N-acetyltransferase